MSGKSPITVLDSLNLGLHQAMQDDPKVLQMSLAATKLAQIETTVVGNGKALDNANAGIRVEGSIELDERSIKSQATHVGGRVEEMLITFEGEYVKAGQKIGTIYSTDILAASQELLTAAQFDKTIEGLNALRRTMLTLLLVASFCVVLDIGYCAEEKTRC